MRQFQLLRVQVHLFFILKYNLLRILSVESVILEIWTVEDLKELLIYLYM